MNAEEYAWSKWLYLSTASWVDKDKKPILKYLILKSAKEGLLKTQNITP
jgi:hypothetical protein